jgi:hypothetical protein
MATTDQKKQNTDVAHHIFERQIIKDQKDAMFGICRSFTASDEKLTHVREMRGHVSPQDVIVARDYPGYKMISLSGEQSDDAIGILLASDIKTRDSLYGFSKILAQPTIAQTIIATLLPRPNYAVKRGQYLIEESKIREVTKETLAALGETRFSVVTAFGHVMVMTLSHLNLVLPDQDKKIVRTSDQYIVSMDGLSKIVMIDAMKDMFNNQRLAGISKDLDQDSVPAVIANVVAKHLRTISQLVPEISLRMQQLSLVEQVVSTYLADPTALPEVIQAYPTLHSLANFANFLERSKVSVTPAPIGAANSDIKEALDNVLTVINSATSIEVLPLSKLRDHYGFVPASTAGLYKGGVLYAVPGQQSRMSVYEALEEEDGLTLRQQPLEYAAVAKLADDVNKAILNPVAIKGLANIIADEMAAATFEVGDRPVLRTVGISDPELDVLALAMATSVSFNSPEKSGNMIATLSPIFGVTVAEQWLMHVSASAGSEVYFDSPSTTLLYAYGTICANNANQEVEASGLPARPQSLELQIFAPTKFVGEMNTMLSDDIQRPYKVKLPSDLSIAGQKDISLHLVIPLLPVLLPPPDNDGNVETLGDTKVRYVSVNEPGVDGYSTMMMNIATAYSMSSDSILAAKARSWLIEVIGEIMKSPVNTNTAIKALQVALINSGIDTRLLRSKYSELMILSFFATALATLVRFGKMNSNNVVSIMNKVETTGLSLKASALMMSMPRAAVGSNHPNITNK